MQMFYDFRLIFYFLSKWNHYYSKIHALIQSKRLNQCFQVSKFFYKFSKYSIKTDKYFYKLFTYTSREDIINLKYIFQDLNNIVLALKLMSQNNIEIR